MKYHQVLTGDYNRYIESDNGLVYSIFFVMTAKISCNKHHSYYDVCRLWSTSHLSDDAWKSLAIAISRLFVEVLEKTKVFRRRAGGRVVAIAAITANPDVGTDNISKCKCSR